MGIADPRRADIFLIFCEFSFMQKLMKEKKLGLAKILSHTCRDIDDICVVNNSFFDRQLHKIFPDSLIANRSGNDCTVAAYLDVLVSVGQNGFSTSVYHKVDDFSFSVVLYTFPGNNVPINMGYNVFSSQQLRFARICSVKDDFVERAEKVLFHHVKQRIFN